MTSPDENVKPESDAKDDEVLAPATPGAEALPLSDDEDDERSEG